MSMIEDDYHILLVCPKYRHLRQKLFTPYFWKWSSLQKLMSSSSPQTLLQLSKILFLVFKERQTWLLWILFLYVPIIYKSILILLKHTSKFTFSICTLIIWIVYNTLLVKVHANHLLSLAINSVIYISANKVYVMFCYVYLSFCHGFVKVMFIWECDKTTSLVYIYITLKRLSKWHMIAQDYNWNT